MRSVSDGNADRAEAEKVSGSARKAVASPTGGTAGCLLPQSITVSLLLREIRFLSQLALLTPRGNFASQLLHETLLHFYHRITQNICFARLGPTQFTKLHLSPLHSSTSDHISSYATSLSPSVSDPCIASRASNAGLTPCPEPRVAREIARNRLSLRLIG